MAHAHRWRFTRSLSLMSIGVACLALGCSPDARVANGTVISSSGRFSPESKAWTLTVASNGRYDLTVAAYPGITQHSGWQPQQGWLLFIEDTNHFWEFDGTSNLYLFTWDANGSLGRYGMNRRPVPTRLLGALPTNLRAELHQMQKSTPTKGLSQ